MSCSCRFRKTIIDKKFYFNPERIVYLDNCATTAVDPAVLGAADRMNRQLFANPSSLHLSGTKVWEKLEPKTV
jgi:selenocysteine lyase/cysteine desulfurase